MKVTKCDFFENIFENILEIVIFVGDLCGIGPGLLLKIGTKAL